MKVLLDTHTWIWWHTRPEALSAKARAIIEDSKQHEELLLSAISVWEFCKLIALNRLRLSTNTWDWIEQAIDMPKLRLLPISPEIAYSSTVLPGSFHDDPADQIIVASARLEGATVVTKDRLIHRYQAVRSYW